MASLPTNNPWFATTLGLAGIIVGYVVATGVNGGINFPSPSAQNGQPTVQDEPVPDDPGTPATVDDDAVLGDKKAKVTIIEFTDYQCPFCERHYTQTFKSIKKDYIDTGKVKYVVRDFPLSFHPNAQKAAESAECAGDQGKYFEMHDLLFGKQTNWVDQTDPLPAFKQFATDLGLDASKFNSCLTESKNAEEIGKDLQDGMASNIDGTPGFWILGPDGETKKISGAYPYDTFKTEFDAMLK